MAHMQKLLDSDNRNSQKTITAVNKVFPRFSLLIENFVNIFDKLGSLWGEVCEFDKYQKELLEWAKNFGVAPADVLPLLDQATFIGETDSTDETLGAKSAFQAQENILVKSFLTLRLNRDFLYGLTDIMRLRITAARGYTRVQAETAALIKILKDNCELPGEWLETLDDEKGVKFYRTWHRKIKIAIKDLNLEWDYQRASGTALHSRIGGVASALLVDKKKRKPGEIILNFQEVDDIKYLVIYLGLYLRFHRKILEKVDQLFPEIANDQLNTLELPGLFVLENEFWKVAASAGRALNII